MTMDDSNSLGTSDDGHATMQLEEVSIWRDIGRSTPHGYCIMTRVQEPKNLSTALVPRGFTARSSIGSEDIRHRFYSLHYSNRLKAETDPV